MAENVNVKVNNTCNWPLYFKRIMSQGDVKVPANAHNYPLVPIDELTAQIQNRNALFIGTDGAGSHARIQICDEAVRKAVFGIPAEVKHEPVIVDSDSVKALLEVRNKDKFNEQLKALVKTDAEKASLLKIVDEVGGSNIAAWKMDAIRALAETGLF